MSRPTRSCFWAALIPLCLASWTHAQTPFTPTGRWGQASTVLDGVLIIYGGRTDPANSIGYAQAPPTDDLFTLDLSKTFDVNSPPWEFVSGSSNSSTNHGPALAFHTITPYTTADILVFGGDGGNSEPVKTLNDSAILLNVFTLFDPAFQLDPSVSNNPMRRIYHTACEANGKIFIVGGLKDDGSNTALSDHYMFDSDQKAFIALPSGGPPAIFGHAAIILGDGRLLVFGGSCPSQQDVTVFSTIWVLDTTQSTLSWTTVRVDTNPPPPQRREFAVVLLPGDLILIHGGVDANLAQTTFSDGWILDTTKNPMIWTQVSALTQLGPRRDHFAAASGSDVVFGFGFGLNGPAPANISIYDSASNTFAPSFVPPATPTTSLTLARPTASHANTATDQTMTITTTNAAGHTTTFTTTSHGISPTVSSTSTRPEPTSTEEPAGANSKKTTAIAIGAIFGILGVAGTVLVVVYVSRRKRRPHRQGSFRLLPPDEDGGPPPNVEKVRMAGTDWDRGVPQSGILTLLGLGQKRTQQNRERVDMFGDDDARQYDIDAWGADARRRQGTSGTAWTDPEGSVAGGGFYGMVAGSLQSLRNLGAGSMQSLKSLGEKVAGPSTGNPPQWWDRENLPLDPFSDDQALLRGEGAGSGPTAMTFAAAARPRGGQYNSNGSSANMYADPFSDPEIEVLHDAGSEDGRVSDELDSRAGSNSQSTLLHASSATPALVRPVSNVSHTGSNSDPATSVSSRDFSSGSETMRATSRSSHDGTKSPPPTSIVGAIGMPTQPMKRSDTWWTRFTRTPLRAAAGSSQPHIRDPNPAPRLLAIQESTNSGSPDSPESRHSQARSIKPQEGSMSSLRTVDTDLLERMGGHMDVVQRMPSTSTHHSSPESTRDVHPSLSGHRYTLGPDIPPVPQSPISQEEVMSPLPMSPPRLPGKLPLGDESDTETNAARPRKKVKYGLVERASLYVANPDDRRTSSQDTGES